MECAIEDPVKFLIQIHIGLMDSYPLLAGMNDRIFGFATTYQTSDVLRCLRQYVKSQMLMIFINFSVYPHEESKEAQPGRSRPSFCQPHILRAIRCSVDMVNFSSEESFTSKLTIRMYS